MIEAELANMTGNSSNSTFECPEGDIVEYIMKLLGPDSDTVQQLVANDCRVGNSSSLAPLSVSHKHNFHMLDAAQKFYAYLTPFVIVIGLVGNALSVKVFMCPRLRKVSASLYLTALALSDSLVLITYVLVDWLAKGLHIWPGRHTFNILAWPGSCQTVLFFSYIFRFVSSWLIVIFTVERFIGVCRPLYRRAWCTNSFAKRAITGIFLFGACISSYKPALTGVVMQGNVTVCAHKPEFVMSSFVMDSVYACLITVVPFTIITLLNSLIIHKLHQTKNRQMRSKFSVDGGSIKLEFTAILLIVSTTFIVLTIPYFVLWCMNFHNKLDGRLTLSNPTDGIRMRGWMYIAKTVFFSNYCVNLFLYSLTGTYFRRQLFYLMCRGDLRFTPASYYVSVASNTQNSTRIALVPRMPSNITSAPQPKNTPTTVANELD